MLHVYYGDGKGKTTAAIGLAVRALGCGQTVYLVQFLKGRGTGEVDFLEKTPGITILRGKTASCFTFQMNEAQKAECAQRQAEIFDEGLAMARQGRCNLLVLDEVLDAVRLGFLPEDALRELTRQTALAAEVVVTGRGPAPWLLEAADYVTHMVKEKHPYDRGISARRGVEY